MRVVLVWLLLATAVFASPQSTVFISEDRLALLRDDIANHFEPTWRGWQTLHQAAEADINHAAQAVESLSVSGAQSLSDDGRIAYEEALAYRVTGDARYGRAARRILSAWSSTLGGVSIDDRSRLAVSRYFPIFIFAADMMRRTPIWTVSDELAFEGMLRQRIAPASTSRWRSDNLHDTPGVGNNHATWGVLLDACIAVYGDDRALIDVVRHRWQDLLDVHIASDGTLPLELDRRHGMTYMNLTLWADTLTAEVLANANVDVYDSEAGQRLHRAFDTAVDWTINPSHYAAVMGPKRMGADDFAYFTILNHHFPNPDCEWLLRHRKPRSDVPVPFLLFSHGAR